MTQWHTKQPWTTACFYGKLSVPVNWICQKKAIFNSTESVVPKYPIRCNKKCVKMRGVEHFSKTANTNFFSLDWTGGRRALKIRFSECLDPPEKQTPLHEEGGGSPQNSGAAWCSLSWESSRNSAQERFKKTPKFSFGVRFCSSSIGHRRCANRTIDGVAIRAVPSGMWFHLHSLDQWESVVHIARALDTARAP